MADKRISQLAERVDIANNDVVPIVASGATTTNKATISSIQTFMQENLDVGVTSVGITIGTSGTDVSVTGSPVTTSGNITINIPDASASARGVVTSESQTFGGVKTFADGLSLPSLGGGNQITKIVNIGTLHQGSGSLNQIGFNSGNNIYFGKGLSNGGVISWNNAAVRYYTLQDADGTLAFTSDIPSLAGYVTLDTAQTITAQKTFTTSGSSDTMIISHGSGSGFALDVIKAGNNEALRVTKTSGSGNAVTISGGDFEAGAAKFGGTVRPTTNMIADLGSGSIRWSTLFGRNIDLTEDAIINGVNVGRGAGSVASNTRLGTSALGANTTGTGNTSIGSSSLSLNTTGSLNTSVGTGSLQANTIGGSNTSVGVNSLLNNTEGSANTSVGSNSLSYNTTGGSNTSVGSVALYNNTTGSGNTALGWASLYNNINGSNNSALGYLSLYENTTGQTNVGIGFYSLFKNTTGSNNTALGYTSGAYIADGSTANSISNNSVYIGAYTKALGNDQTNQIVIGHSVIGNGSNTVTLGNDSITNTYLKGAVTLTGALNGTSAVFSSDFTQNETSKVGISFASGFGQINSWGANTSTYGGLKFQLSASNGGTFNALTLDSTGAATFSSRINGVVGGTAYNTAGLWLQGSSSTDGIAIGGTGGGDKTIDTYGGTLKINSTSGNGLSVTGAATFSSSVTATNTLLNSTSTQLILQNADGGGNAEKVGMFMMSNDVFKLSSLNDNNTTRVDNIITANVISGNVGIGTDTAGQKLEIANGALDTYLKISSTGNTKDTGILLSNGTQGYYVGTAGHLVSNSFEIYNSTTSALLLNIAPTGAATFGSSVQATSGKFFSANGTTYASPAQLRVDGGGVNNNYAQIVFTDSALSDGKISYFPAAAAENRYFSISARQIESDFVIRGSGKVGIGTASPNEKLHVSGAISATGTATTSFASSATMDFSSGFTRFISRGSDSSTSAGFRFLNESSNSSIAFESMRITSGGFFKASNTGGYIAAQSFHELRTGDNARALLITNASTTLSQENGLDIIFSNASPNNATSKFIVCEDSSAFRFIVYSNGNVQNTNNSYGSLSDIKLKENIEDATPKLDDLMKVKVRNYNLIGDDKKQIGVIAQELEEVFPAMIDESEDFEEVEVPQVDEEGNEILNEEGEVVTEKQRVSKGTSTKSVKYSVFVPMLIKAMQEQQEQIKELKTEIDSLKNQMQ
jgi:hypothetical protein